jgi:hypothetical protein
VPRVANPSALGVMKTQMFGFKRLERSRALKCREEREKGLRSLSLWAKTFDIRQRFCEPVSQAVSAEGLASAFSSGPEVVCRLAVALKSAFAT